MEKQDNLKERMESEGFGEIEKMEGIEAPEYIEEYVEKKEVKKSEDETLNKIQKWL